MPPISARAKARKIELERQDLRHCNGCDTIKPLDQFYRHKRDGYGDRCKLCHADRNNQARKSRVERLLTEGYKVCTRCERTLLIDQFHRQVNKINSLRSTCVECRREVYLTRKYGLKQGEYDQMLKDQGGVCAICKRSFNPLLMHVDHCHTTGAVRGILCENCNRGIGMFQDDPEIMRRAVIYVGRIISGETER